METMSNRSSQPEEFGPKKPIVSPLAPPLRISMNASPNRLSLVSSPFVEQGPHSECKTFSQLIGGIPLVDAQRPTSQRGDINGSNEQASETINIPPKSARFKSMMPSKLPIPCSPCVTIPPGLSPTTLLDSPILFSTAQAEPSPTTGTFSMPFLHGVAAQSSDKFGELLVQDGRASFAFKPHPQLPMPLLSSLHTIGLSHCDVELEPHAQVPSSSPAAGPIIEPVPFEASPPLTISTQQPQSEDRAFTHVTEMSEGSMPQLLAPQAILPTYLVERPSDDGYNWRKYGQKQVKGSEYPRSYYKCTHPNCLVKKKIERSYEGHITEIVYKGEHNHAKPQHTRWSSAASDGSQILGRECGKNDELSVVARGAHLFSYLNGAPETSLGSMTDDDVENGGNDEPYSKRRQIEQCRDSFNTPLRTVREPRVVVQTMSKVDILDDGYRWRKYGQKVVKGNHHPRSYYKCTNLGCSVRKHVERSAVDSKAVITTYEGKHNHDVPVARSGHHVIHGNAASVSPASSLLGSSALVTPPEPAVSLQEQFLGKFVGINPPVQDQIDSKMEPKAEQSNMNRRSNMMGLDEGSGFFYRAAVVKPKEEPEDVDHLGRFLQHSYHPNTSPFVAQRVMLGVENVTSLGGDVHT